MLILAEPVNFVAQGEYILNGLKEIEVTDSFLGLDQEDKQCQNEESHDNCRTRHHIDTLLNECGCLPFDIRLSKKVYLSVPVQCESYYPPFICLGTPLFFKGPNQLHRKY